MNVTASNKLIDLSLLTRYDGKLKTYISGRIGQLGNKTEASEGQAAVPYADVKDYVDTLVATINGSAATLEGRVAANEAALTILNGASTVEGSVAKQVADAIADVIDGAPEAFDTLKEIAAWIGTGDVENTTAATMLSDIATLKGDNQTAGSVAKAEKDAKDYADGLSNAIKGNATTDTAESKTIEGLSKAIAAEKTRAEGAEEGLDGRLDTIEGEGEGSIKKAVKDLADGAVKTNADAIAVINKEADQTKDSKSIAGAKLYAADAAATAKSEAISAVQGESTETVASVDAKVEALALASNDEIDALFA